MRRIVCQAGLVLALVAPAAWVAADTAAFDRSMGPVLESYLEIHDALASGRYEDAVKHARVIEEAAGRLDASAVTGDHARIYKALPEELKAAAVKVAAAKDLASAREAYKELSEPMAAWAGMSAPAGIYVFSCPMAEARWVQRGKEVRNPYYGAGEMLKCGELASTGGEGAAGKHGHSPAKKHGEGM